MKVIEAKRRPHWGHGGVSIVGTWGNLLMEPSRAAWEEGLSAPPPPTSQVRRLSVQYKHLIQHQLQNEAIHIADTPGHQGCPGGVLEGYLEADLGTTQRKLCS